MQCMTMGGCAGVWVWGCGATLPVLRGSRGVEPCQSRGLNGPREFRVEPRLAALAQRFGAVGVAEQRGGGRDKRGIIVGRYDDAALIISKVFGDLTDPIAHHRQPRRQIVGKLHGAFGAVEQALGHRIERHIARRKVERQRGRGCQPCITTLSATPRAARAAPKRRASS